MASRAQWRPVMGGNIELSVYRRLDNRLEGLPDDSPRARELHQLRQRALHEVLDGEPRLAVLDWGDTDDAQPHELVTILIAVVAQPLVVEGLKFVGEKLAEKAVEEGASSIVKWLIAKLRPKQAAKQVLDFQIRLPDGTTVSCDPPEGSGEITINFRDGKLERIQYSQTT
jgi:hypothetical protein